MLYKVLQTKECPIYKALIKPSDGHGSANPLTANSENSF